MFPVKAERPAGMPTVDTIDWSSPGWRFCRNICSIRATTFSVSSTRVPIGARRKTRNWLSSEAGKNSLPMSGTSAGWPRRREHADHDDLRWPSALEHVLVPASSRSKNAWLSRMKRSRRRRLAGSGNARDASSRRHMSGVTVRETRNDANSENEIVKVRGMKRSFDCPRGRSWAGTPRSS